MPAFTSYRGLADIRRIGQVFASVRAWRGAALAAVPLWLSALFMTASPVRADNSLTLELPSSPQATAQKAAERAREAADRVPEAPRSTAGNIREGQSITSRPGSRTYYSSRGQGRDSERVVGRLGQVERAIPIYRSQSARSARLSTAPAGTYLAIQSDAGNWYGILMSDGSLGWLHKQNVHLLEYQVVSNGATPQPFPGIADGSYTDGLPSSRTVFFRGDPEALFREAYKYLGMPYHFGGNAASGIDCSAFVMDVFRVCGYSLPRHSSDQTTFGAAIPKDQIQPGDRLYFGNAAARNITHTGIYLGNGYFIHASSNAHGVAISQLSEALYERMYICARR